MHAPYTHLKPQSYDNFQVLSLFFLHEAGSFSRWPRPGYPSSGLGDMNTFYWLFSGGVPSGSRRGICSNNVSAKGLSGTGRCRHISIAGLTVPQTPETALARDLDGIFMQVQKKYDRNEQQNCLQHFCKQAKPVEFTDYGGSV